MTTTDTDNEDSTLDVALHCGECDAPVTLTLDTPIGLGGPDLKTPVPLCGTGCVERNVDRVSKNWDRCSCGAVVSSYDLLRTSARRGIIGCPSCELTGEPTAVAQLTHYWASPAGALCVPPGESSEGKATSIRRSRVNCPACLHALMVTSEMKRNGQAVRP